ncbi:MAG: hypothetical protein R3C28_30160 [Pirellulaceae bacterium]
MVAILLIVVGLILPIAGLGAAFVAGGLFDATGQLTSTMAFDQFGRVDWPNSVQTIASVVSIALLIVGGCMIMFVRREQGSVHAFRAFLATLGMVSAVWLARACVAAINWFDVHNRLVNETIVGANMLGEGFFNRLFVCLALILVSTFLFAWPSAAVTERKTTSSELGA